MKREIYGAFGQLIQRHGFMTTQRGLSCLATAAIFVRMTGEEPTALKLMEYWNLSRRSAFRETAAWRTISGGADLGEVARQVVAAYVAEDLASASPGALAFDLIGFVPAQ